MKSITNGRIIKAVIFFIAIKYIYIIQKRIKYNIYEKNIDKIISLNAIEKSNIFKQSDIKLKVTYINYSFSYNYNTTKIEYGIGFYDENKNLIKPSDLTLKYNIHVLCYFTEIYNNISVISLANVYKNKFYKCIEFFKMKGKINFGIKIYINIKKKIFIKINLFSEKIINYRKLLYKKDNEFNSYLISYRFLANNSKINNQGRNMLFNESSKLRKSYYDFPNFYIKSQINITSQWIYKNIYNNYFCLCKYTKEKCLYENIPKKCKYYFYLSIIDENKNLYNSY